MHLYACGQVLYRFNDRTIKKKFTKSFISRNIYWLAIVTANEI
jgi:hypothetical protein